MDLSYGIEIISIKDSIISIYQNNDIKTINIKDNIANFYRVAYLKRSSKRRFVMLCNTNKYETYIVILDLNTMKLSIPFNKISNETLNIYNQSPNKVAFMLYGTIQYKCYLINMDNKIMLEVNNITLFSNYETAYQLEYIANNLNVISPSLISPSYNNYKINSAYNITDIVALINDQYLLINDVGLLKKHNLNDNKVDNIVK